MKDIVSQALSDNKISHEEFLLVKSEVEEYHQMKKSIRKKFRCEKTDQQHPSTADLKRMERQIRAAILKSLTQSEGQLVREEPS